MLKINNRNFYFSLIFLFLLGCTSVTPKVGHKTRNWDSNYTEIVEINTEPAYCRIYLQGEYLGVSPLVHKINGGPVVTKQKGSYTYEYFKEYGPLGPVPMSWGDRNHSQTSWGEIYGSLVNEQKHTISSVCESYMPKTESFFINNKSDIFKKAIREVTASNGKVSAPVGKRSVLLISDPVVSPTKNINTQEQQQQQQQQQTIVFPNGNNNNSGNDCVKECKIMYLKGELKQGTVEECIKLLCM